MLLKNARNLAENLRRPLLFVCFGNRLKKNFEDLFFGDRLRKFFENLFEEHLRQCPWPWSQALCSALHLC